MSRHMRPEFCKALGIHKIDGPMDPGGHPCVWATGGCESCYVLGYLRRWRNAPTGRYLVAKIKQDGARWPLWTPGHVDGIEFIRFCSRGEGLRHREDVEHVRWLVTGSPWCEYILPSRCHNNPMMRGLVESRLFGIPNLHILASVDRCTRRDHFDSLVSSGWSTMGFFSRKDGPHPLAHGSVVRCPKTWRGAHGADACRKCGETGDGCFRSERKDVFLRLHK